MGANSLLGEYFNVPKEYRPKITDTTQVENSNILGEAPVSVNPPDLAPQQITPSPNEVTMTEEGPEITGSLEPNTNYLAPAETQTIDLSKSNVGNFAAPRNALFQDYKPKTIEQISNELETERANELPFNLPEDQFTKYWGQRVGGVPLDMLVRVAGMAANALDPKGFGGRLGKDLMGMGHEAYNERARREYDLPNSLLKRRLTIAQIRNAELKETPTEWKVYYEYAKANGIPADKAVENFINMKHRAEKEGFHYERDNWGNVHVWKNGQYTGATKAAGLDLSKVAGPVTVSKSGDVTIFPKVGTEPISVTKGAGKPQQVPSGNIPKVKYHEVNASGVQVTTMTDGKQYVSDENGELVPAKPEDLKGLKPQKAEGKESDREKRRRERKANKAAKEVEEAKKSGKVPASAKAGDYKGVAAYQTADGIIRNVKTHEILYDPNKK